MKKSKTFLNDEEIRALDNVNLIGFSVLYHLAQDKIADHQKVHEADSIRRDFLGAHLNFLNNHLDSDFKVRDAYQDLAKRLTKLFTACNHLDRDTSPQKHPTMPKKPSLLPKNMHDEIPHAPAGNISDKVWKKYLEEHSHLPINSRNILNLHDTIKHGYDTLIKAAKRHHLELAPLHDDYKKITPITSKRGGPIKKH